MTQPTPDIPRMIALLRLKRVYESPDGHTAAACYLKLVLLVIWAYPDKRLSLRTLTDLAGLSVATSWRCLKVLQGLELITLSVDESLAKTTARTRYRVNTEKLIELVFSLPPRRQHRKSMATIKRELLQAAAS